MTVRHLLLAGASLLLAVLVAVPLGLAVSRTASAEAVVRSVGLLQTIPGLALLAFLLPLVGIGVIPALIALFLYSRCIRSCATRAPACRKWTEERRRPRTPSA
ncbi:MAG: hypothetical protein R2712_21025 [Vicinamibacterales bacterium]